jgi:hypothetical protein
MAYVSLITALLPPRIWAGAPGTQFTFLAPVGYDDVDGRMYRLFVTLGTVPGGDIDLSFCIVCDHTDGTVYDYWDSRDIGTIIPKEERGHILAVLLQIVRDVIVQAQFPEVVMHTFLPNLPPKALVKYLKIEQEFTNLGYAVVRSVTPSSYYSWRFSRATAVPSASG